MIQNTPSNIDIKKLKESTIKIFNDCMLPNGCIVAAPTHMPYYPKDAKSYLYSWPGRDMGFNLAAMYLLGYDYYEVALRWLWERAEDFQHSLHPEYKGLIYRSYHANGLIREHQFQPDQGATLIWSINFKKEQSGGQLTELEEIVVNRLAQNYARIWEGEGFNLATEDLWEERGLKPQEGDFTYSLAACAKAMSIASKLLDEEEFQKTSDEMTNTVNKYCHESDNGEIPRHFGGTLGVDTTIDGSLSGLVWPFNIGFPESDLRNTLARIESEITNEFGVFRYPNDKYEGSDSIHRKNVNAGTWPLLTFWLSIAYSELGEEGKAKQYFELVFENLNDDYMIPEQIFCCHPIPWDGIKPLLWSHSMAIFAAWKLGLF